MDATLENVERLGTIDHRNPLRISGQFSLVQQNGKKHVVSRTMDEHLKFQKERRIKFYRKNFTEKGLEIDFNSIPKRTFEKTSRLLILKKKSIKYVK